MANKERLQFLLDKYLSGEIAPEEENEMFIAIASGGYGDVLSAHIVESFQNPAINGLDVSDEKAREIVNKIIQAEKETASVIPFSKKRNGWKYWMAAASVILVLGAGLYFFNKEAIKQNPVAAAVIKTKDALVTKENDSDLAMYITLEDGTTVTLKSGAVLQYPEHFSGNRREVYIEGEAFFQVSKNANKPFYVYNHKLVTHVLGTSFTIKTDVQKKKIEVAVTSGKVEVYERGNDDAGDKEVAKNNGVVLTPNQKVIYTEDDNRFDATLVDVPLPIKSKDTLSIAKPELKPSFIYEAEPFQHIIKAMIAEYGVNIEVEDENINNCLFTGDITDQNLYKKLDILCQSLNDMYEVKGTTILIRGKGCK